MYRILRSWHRFAASDACVWAIYIYIASGFSFCFFAFPSTSMTKLPLSAPPILDLSHSSMDLSC